MLELIYYAPHLGILSLIIAGLIYLYVKKQPNGSEAMGDIEAMIHKGAMAFLIKEYLIIVIFIIVVFFSLGFLLGQWKTSVAFVIGAFCSMAAGFIGIIAAAKGNSRTAEAANRSGQAKALTISYFSGSVMGLTVAGLGILGMGFYIRYYGVDPITVQHISGLALGTSSIALFGRIGGGIYNQAAELGVNLVGKLEAAIPKDDTRNPGVIADYVGDNVGDIVGMGADIFESFICSIIACIILSATLHLNTTEGLNAFIKEYPVLKDLSATTITMKFIAMPLLIAMAGMASSFIGIFSIKLFQKGSPANALSYTTIITTGILIILTVFITIFMGMPWVSILAILSGLMCGTAIGLITEYHTSGLPIRKIAEQSKTGPGTVIITGIAVGMRSTYLPIIFICIAVFIGYQAAGIYGIGLSAVGMLATTGATMAINSYSPIANNAAGISKLTALGPEARKITGGLDYLGNTIAATGKGYATGAAILTALALIMAFIQVAELDSIDIKNPFVVIGLFIGAIVPMVCAALIMTAVGKAAFSIVEEIRRQFRETTGLLEGKEGVRPDPKRCVSTTTSSALKKMTAPGLIVILTPVAVGFLLGKEALGGMLMGSTIVSACMAFFMANSGGAWNNAKKYVEEGFIGGKGSDNHKAIKISDAIGGPFKDTSGPSMNVLIKFMPVVSLILAPLLPNMNVFSRF